MPTEAERLANMEAELADRARRGAHIPAWLEAQALQLRQRLEDASYHQHEGEVHGNGGIPWWVKAAVAGMALLVAGAVLAGLV